MRKTEKLMKEENCVREAQQVQRFLHLLSLVCTLLEYLSTTQSQR